MKRVRSDMRPIPFVGIRRSRGAGRALVMGLAGVAVLALATPGLAQNAGLDLWERGGCADCHGKVADGAGDPAFPAGGDLRSGKLNRDQLIETISCGRPEKKMPSYLKGAYTEASCYGMPVAAVPPVAPRPDAFTASEVQALTDFLLEFVVGKTRVTRRLCAVFLGSEAVPECYELPR